MSGTSTSPNQLPALGILAGIPENWVMNDKLATAEKKSWMHDLWSNTPQ